jgi:RNA polymerase sigma-70 factor, ECF subfamily
MSVEASRHDVFDVHTQSQPHTRDEHEWVRSVRMGDQTAFEAMYRAYYRALVGFTYTYVGSEAVAEEHVQELFLAIWRQRDHWEVQSTLRAYLYGAARNRALNHLAHEHIARAVTEDALVEERAIGMGAAPAAIDEVVEQEELAAAVQRAIERLPARCRATFTLCRDHGLTYAETARVMGVSEYTVKIQMARALKAMRLSLASWLT